MRYIKYLSALLSFGITLYPAQDNKKVMVCYSDFYPNKVKNYDFLIVEPTYFNSADVHTLKTNNKIVLAYLSLGEVNKNSEMDKALKAFTIGENKIWNSRILDLGNKETTQYLSKLVDSYLELGFDGIFMDNIDNYTQWGPTPNRLVDLLLFLTKTRQKYPSIYLMQNAGLEILDQTASLINSLAIESVATDYNFKTKKYRLREAKDFNLKKSELQEVMKQYQLPLIVIEYADTPQLKQQVEKRLKGQDWSIFTGKIELNSIANP